MYRTESCEQKLNMFQNVTGNWSGLYFPKRTVKSHDKYKPWITPEYKNLIAKRQRAFIRGDNSLYCKLSNLVVPVGKRLRPTVHFSIPNWQN